MKTINIITERFALAAVWLATCAAGAAVNTAELSSEALKQALLAEHWPRVTELCRQVRTNDDSPMRPAIFGHALLAMNENCESLRLFLSLSNQVARQAWSEWTEAFVKSNPTNP